MKPSFKKGLPQRIYYFLLRIAFILSLFTLLADDFWRISPARAACTIDGNVFQDYNANAARDQREPGTENVRVTAFQSTAPAQPNLPPPPVSDLDVATTTTDENGDYSLTVPIDGEVRIEFSEIPVLLSSGRFAPNNQSSTTITFVDCSGVVSGIDLAISNPGQFCSLDTPQLGTSCYVLNDQRTGVSANTPTFVTFPYDAEGDPTPGVDPEVPMAVAQQIGTTWGLGYHRRTDSFLVGSFMKRHAGFGSSDPNDPTSPTTTGGIYRISPASATDPAEVTVSMFIDLGATTGADPHPTSLTSCFPGGVQPQGRTRDCWQYDSEAYELVGKASLGDIDISEDDRRLYAVNLLTRQLVEVPITTTQAGPVAGTPRNYALNSSTLPGLLDPTTGCPAVDYRPFGLGIHRGRVYVGAVCSAESTQDRADMRAYVHSFDPLNPGQGFQLDITFPLDYPRRCADNAPGCNNGLRTADWQPWTNDWPAPSGTVVIYPEPWVTDIVFDGDHMIIGLRDRFGDRTGNMRPPPFQFNDDTLFLGITAGDALRACYDTAAGTWVLEDNATCGSITTNGEDNTQGPDSRTPPNQVGGEYYFEDMNDPVANNRHDEILIGGLVNIPGVVTFATTAFDPLPPSGGDDGLFDGGVVWFNHDTGERTQNFRIFNDSQGGPNNTFGKSNGLGDLEVVCGPPPLEIGNRVWEDLDRNGLQDPGEQPLANVTLQLYMLQDRWGRPVLDPVTGSPGRLVGQAVTDAAGEYYFNEQNVFQGSINGTPITPEAEINFADLNGNGRRDPVEPVGVMPESIYEIRLDHPDNYNGGPLSQYFITPNNTRVINDQNVLIRDSDGTNRNRNELVSTTNFPAVRLTTLDFGDNNHTYDFGFALQPPPLVTPPPPGPEVSGGGGTLTVEKGVNPPFAAPGQRVVWTITVSNNSGAPITNVNINDPVSSSLQILENEITDSSPTGTVTVNGQLVTFTQPVMAAGEVVTITLVTRVRGDVPVPFIIPNEIPDYGARAQILSVTQLPATGESPWEAWRVPLFIAAGATFLLGGAWWWRRRKTQRTP